MANQTQSKFCELAEFDAAMRKLVAVPKSAMAAREKKWQAAKKKAAKKL